MLRPPLAVDLVMVSSTKTEEEVGRSHVERLANLILEMGGLTSVPVVKKSGIDPESGDDLYEIVTGDLEYYAAVKAYEIDPDQASETIRVYAVPEEKAEAARNQNQFISGSGSSTARSGSEHSRSEDSRSEDSRSESNLTLSNLISRMERLEQQVTTDLSKHRQEVEGILTQAMPKPLQPLEVINSVPDPRSVALLEEKLKAVCLPAIASAILERIIEIKNERSAPISSFKDLMEALGKRKVGSKKQNYMSGEKMLEFFDQWNLDARKVSGKSRS